MNKKYEHLENLRQKIASRVKNKKASSALASLWVEFDDCLEQFKPNCKESVDAVKKLKKIRTKIREVINGGANADV